MSFIRREVWGVFYEICPVVEITYFVQTRVLRNMDLTRVYVVIYCKVLTLFSNDVNQTCVRKFLYLHALLVSVMPWPKWNPFNVRVSPRRWTTFPGASTTVSCSTPGPCRRTWRRAGPRITASTSLWGCRTAASGVSGSSPPPPPHPPRWPPPSSSASSPSCSSSPAFPRCHETSYVI